MPELNTNEVPSNVNKSELIDKMLKDPLSFKDDDLELLIKIGLDFSDIRTCIKRIYNLNESQLIETSNANSGFLGGLNKKSTEDRQKEYYKRCENRKGNGYTKIYAEGDSWFQFPWFVTDIIDWLNKDDKYLIFSEAYAGDWITNIIYENQYISSLTVHSPDIFLISGGGNDLVGNNRIAIMVNKKNDRTINNTSINDNSISEAEKAAMIDAQQYISKEFYAFIWTLKAQYYLLFDSIYNKSPHKNMITITHGYAYPYPKKGVNWSFDVRQPTVNHMEDTGQWLFRPLMIKGITDPVTQRAIAMVLIYEFNNMLIDLARRNNFTNLYHIDCRQVPKNQNCWYDELHLKSEYFQKVAKAYKKVIDTRGKGLEKVINADEIN